MSIYSLYTFCGGIFSLFLGGFVYFKNKKSSQNTSFALMCISIVVWLFSYTVCYWTDNIEVAILLARIACTAVVFLGTTFYHFIVTFLELKNEKKFVKVAYLLSFIQLPLFLWTDYLLGGVYKYYWGYYSKAGYLHPLFLLFFFTVCSRGIFLLYLTFWKKKNELPPIKFNQLKYVLIASNIIVLGSVDFIPKYGIEFYPFAFSFILIYMSITAYTIIKYRLMDIRLAITRAGIFLILYAFILGLPFYVGYRINSRFSVFWIAPTLFAIFFTTIGPLIYRILHRKAESLLLAQQRRYQHVLLQASAGMVREHNLDKLLKLIVYIIRRVVKINFAAIFIENEDDKNYILKAVRNHSHIHLSSYSRISCDNPLIEHIKKRKDPFLIDELPLPLRKYFKGGPLEDSLVIPSFIEDRLLGFLILGEKLNRSLYSHDDINVFRILSHQAALAIENCIFFEESKKAQSRIFEAEKLASIGGMADGVAHQMKNRLNLFSIAGGELRLEAEGIAEKYPHLMQEPDFKEAIGYIIKTADALLTNVKRTDSIIRGILNYARTQEKDTFFDYFSLKEIVDLSLELLQVKHEIPSFPLKINLNSVDKIYGVKAQIAEVIYNLLDNAYEATLQRRDLLSEEQRISYSPHVSIEARDNLDSYIISVFDNGIGIKKEEKLKIFAPFFTTKPSYKSSSPGKSGTGIGMYVAKRLIEENHKGKIWFESKYLEGVTFHIELPKKK